MDKRALVKKRLNYPLFHHYGNLSQSGLQTLLNNFSSTPDSLQSAKNLRISQLSSKFNNYDDDDISDYNQYDIQLRDPESDDIEENYNLTKDEFIPIRDELTNLLQSGICRLRYATIEKNDSFMYHVDQPGKDRFVMVVEGAQNFYIKDKDGEHIQPMKPGEVWYVNSNWEHKIENTGSGKRIALLGCYNYKNT